MSKLTDQFTSIHYQRVSTILSACYQRAKKKGLEFSLTEEWMLEKLRGGICEITGTKLQYGARGFNERNRPWGPSIDRKDRSKGYTPENCQLVCWLYNPL